MGRLLRREFYKIDCCVAINELQQRRMNWSERKPPMFMSVRKLVVFCWDFVFDHEVSPLRNIPDVAIRHYILQALGLMWAVAFAVAVGSYTYFAVSLIGHVVLIAAAAITVATWTAAAAKPVIFVPGSSRQDQDSPKG